MSNSVRVKADAVMRHTLQLEVVINAVPSHLISTFVVFADGRLGAARGELEELGLPLPNASLGKESIVRLDDLPGLRYLYQERTQRLLITLDAARLRSQRLNVRPADHPVTPQPTPWGGVLNYSIFTARNTAEDVGWSATSGSTVALDARAFSPGGMLQSGYVLSSTDRHVQWIRLDTAYHDSDPSRLLSWSAGDTIEGGLPWSRPIRLAGVQMQTNFALRPDLITMPLPSLAGVATVPSTVDVYVNNVKTWSQQLAPGPFSVSNVPLVNGAGDVSLVLRTASGEETRSTMPIYASPALLSPGLQSWSVEAGFPRLGYGTSDGSYLSVPVGSATWRDGISERLTVEGHTEAGAGIANGGAGLAVKVATAGVISSAVSASTLGNAHGYQLYAAYETQLSDFRFNATIERSLARYEDLAAATARLGQTNQAASTGGASDIPGQSASSTWAALYNSVLPARLLMSLTAGIPLPIPGASLLSVNDIRLIDGSGNRSNPVTVVYSRALPWRASLSASAFQDMDNRKNAGFSIGLSVPLGAATSGSAQVYGCPQGTTTTVEATHSLGPTAGDFGWRIRDSDGALPYREAVASYRSSYGVLDVGENQGVSGPGTLIQWRGAVSTLGGEVFFSDRIDDAFAVVQTGIPGIEVSSSNQPIGVTDSRGMLLVPTLRAYQVSQITIDPSFLPPDAELPRSRELVAPADRSGVLLPFVIRHDIASAVVEFLSSDGHVIPAGASGRIEGGDDFVVGYDGSAFIRNLAPKNVAKITFGRTTCQARFEFSPQPGEQVRIQAVMCR